jgi:hypothetical protein
MNTEFNKIERRTVRYWFEDGIYETALGLFLLLLGLFFLGYALVREGSTLFYLLSIGVLPVFFLGFWGTKRMVRSLKQKLTYPRTGYVSYRKPEAKRPRRRALLIGGMAGIAGALWGLALSSGRTGFNLMPGLTGLAFAGVLGFLALRSGLGRTVVLAVLSAAAGAFLAFSGWPKMLGLASFYLFLGLSLAISGGLACLLYLRRNPPPDEASR